MERNKDDADRALEAAKMTFGEGNFAAAMKIMLDVETLVSTLEGSQMLEVLKIHTAAESKLGDGEMDWYGILGVNPEADDSMIKKEYKRRARLVHPDKNKGVGAEAAVKLLTEAYSILCDEAKRALHDMKRGVRANPLQPYSSRSSETYRTACPNCKRVYQYLRTYENYPVQCPNCNEQFSARGFHGRAAGRGADGSREPTETEKVKRGRETGNFREGIKRPVTNRKESVAMADKMRKMRREASKTNGGEQRRNTLTAMRTKPAPSAASGQKVDAGTRSERKRKNLDSDAAKDEERIFKRKIPGCDEGDKNELAGEHPKVFGHGFEDSPSSPTLPHSVKADMQKRKIDELNVKQIEAEVKAKAEDEDEEKFREEFGGGSGGQLNENGAKAQSEDNSNNVNWRSVGGRGGTLRERYKGGSPMRSKKGSHNSTFTDSGAKSPTTCNDSTAGVRGGKGCIRRQPDWDRNHFVSNRRQQHTTLVVVFFFLPACNLKGNT